MQDLNNSINTANKINISITEKKIVEASLEAISKAYKPLDSFSMWLLGATGAYAALIISNTKLFCALEHSKYWLYLEILALLISTLCGLCAKFFCSLRIEIYGNSIESLNEKLMPIIEQHFQNAERIENLSQTINTDVNFYRISNQIARSFPDCLKKKVLKASIREIRKARPNYAQCIPFFVWQYSLVLIQSIFLVIAVLVLISSIFF